MAAIFEAFLEGWLVRQQQYLDELLSVQADDQESSSTTENDRKDLVNRIINHYIQYYDAKSRVAHHDVFLLFSPHWFSSFERSLLWIAGFRSALAFQFVSVAVNDLSGEQKQRMSRLQERTRVGTIILNDELASIHESIAWQPFSEVARHIDAETRGADETLEIMKTELENLVASADLLRTATAGEVLEILNTKQCIKFLTVIAQFQMRIRSWGLQRDAERRE